MTAKQLKKIGLVFLVIISIGVTGYMTLEDLSFLDALYMTVATVATVGYGDVVPMTKPGRIFTIALIIFGVGFTYYTITFIMGLAVEGKLKKMLGRRGMDRLISTMKNHIIVCGAGRVGANVIDQLRYEKQPFVVIESNPEIYEHLVDQKIPAVHGDATLDEVLLRVGVEKAKGIITALSDDAHNVYVTLTAKSLNPNLTIVARAERAEAQEKLRRAGASTVIFPSVMGGRQMVSAMTRPVIMDFVENVFYNPELHLDISEIPVASASPLAGKNLAQSRIKDKHDCIVVAIKRGARMITNPSAKEVIRGGDIMVVLGQRDALSELRELAIMDVVADNSEEYVQEFAGE